jgi:hypothetical protein
LNENKILFQKCLDPNEKYYIHFKIFLGNQFCSELLFFIEHLSIFKNLNDDKEKLLEVNNIFDNYLKKNSPNEINVSDSLIQEVIISLQKNNDKIDINIFDNIESHIKYLLFEQFEMFINSTNFKNIEEIEKIDYFIFE